MTIKCSKTRKKKVKSSNGKNILKSKKLFDKLKSSLIKSQTGSGIDSEEINFLLKRL